MISNKSKKINLEQLAKEVAKLKKRIEIIEKRLQKLEFKFPTRV